MATGAAPRKNHVSGKFIAVTFSLMGIWLWWMVANPDKPSAPSAPVLQPGDHVVEVPAAVACKQQDDFDHLLRLVREKDDEAYNKALGRLLLMGGCDVWAKGDTVVVSNVSYSNGMARARKHGDPTEYWTAIPFLR